MEAKKAAVHSQNKNNTHYSPIREGKQKPHSETHFRTDLSALLRLSWKS